MASIGQQIIAARKAKGMTQDALSKALNISRSAVAHWETERTIPDAEMLLRLSKALDYSFEEEAVKAPAGDASPIESAAPLPAAQEKAAKPRKRLWVLLGAAVLACALIAVLLIHNNKAKQILYTDENGKQYTAEFFQQETPREDGKAWLSTEQTLRVQKSEGNEMWMYDRV